MSSARARRTGSVVPRSVSAAICSAAAHPSLRPCRCLSSSAPTLTPKFASRSRLSAREKARSRSRISHSSPDIRSRCSRTGGSLRLASTSWAVSAGQCSMRSVMSLETVAAATWKSSMMIADPSGSFAASLAIDAVTSADTTLSIASRPAASAPDPGATVRRASMKPAQKRNRVSVSPIAGQPGSKARRPGRRPARQQHALARASRRHNDGQPPAQPPPSAGQAAPTC